MYRPKPKKGESLHEPKQTRRLLPTFLFVIGMSVLGFLAQIQWIGYVVILIYLIFAVWKKRPAVEMFSLALITLALVPTGILLSNWLVAQNFGAYSFVFFVCGIITMTIELQRDLRRQR
jgi:uncharacterized protein YebE (UPF0316 family)